MKSPIRNLTAGTLLLLFLASIASAGLRKEGSVAPDFTLKTLEGRPVNLSDYRGKPVLLEFWATWCGPCRIQFPKMAPIHEKYEDQVHFLMVNTAESAATVRAFAGRVEVPGLILMDPTDEVGQLYGTRILPSMFFIDAEGVIHAAVPGAVRDMDLFMKTMLERTGEKVRK